MNQNELKNEIKTGCSIVLQNKKADQNLMGVSVRKEAVELTGQEVMKELGLKSLTFSAMCPHAFLTPL